MIVAPSPICLSIPIPELGEIVVFSVTLIDPNPISPIFTIIPFMIIVVLGIVIAPVLMTVIVIGQEWSG